MQPVNPLCFSLFVGLFSAHAIYGMVIGWKLRKHTAGLSNPIVEASIPSPYGRKLFRRDRIWRRTVIPVWLGVIVLARFLCVG